MFESFQPARPETKEESTCIDSDDEVPVDLVLVALASSLIYSNYLYFVASARTSVVSPECSCMLNEKRVFSLTEYVDAMTRVQKDCYRSPALYVSTMYLMWRTKRQSKDIDLKFNVSGQTISSGVSTFKHLPPTRIMIRK